MKLLLALFVCYVIYCVDAGSAGKKRYDGYKLFSVTVNSEEEADVLTRMQDSIDIWAGIFRNRPTDVHVAPENLNHFRRTLSLNGIPFVETVPDLQKLVDIETMAMSTTDGNSTFSDHYTPNYNELQAWMENIANTYSFASVVDFGKTYEGREIQLIKLSTGNSENKRIVFLDAGLHAREWMTTAVMVWLIEEFTSSYGTDDDITTLLDKYDFYLLPVYNPDGYQYTQDSSRFWRKNRSPSDDPHCPGTDLNRNFDYPEFGGASTSDNPCSDVYHGINALSELESQHLRKFMLSNAEKIVMYINIHAFSQMWFTPWGYTIYRPADADDLDAVAQAGANALYNVHKKTFQVGPASHILYATGGSADDWVKGTADIKYSFGMELRPGPESAKGFLVDPEEIIPSGEEFSAGLQAAIKEIEKIESL